MKLAPVILFVYNRPEHTKQTIAALQKNVLAKETSLFIYADGPKKNISTVRYDEIKKVRAYIKQINGFKNIEIVKQENNLGLSASIIKGVTETMNVFEKVIVLEDDIVTSSGFLNYMNDALELYADEENVGCIHSWNYYLDNNGYKDSTFFLKGADCWGWATWQRAWKLFNQNGNELSTAITSNNLEYDFNRRNTHNFLSMLQGQIDGKNDSWAIRWHASLFLENKYCLHPVKSLVKNIGLDASGTHGYEEILQQHIASNIKLKKIPVEESEWFYQAYKKYTSHRKLQRWQGLKNLLNQSFRQDSKKIL